MKIQGLLIQHLSKLFLTESKKARAYSFILKIDQNFFVYIIEQGKEMSNIISKRSGISSLK